jgi:hypothetical protein
MSGRRRFSRSIFCASFRSCLFEELLAQTSLLCSSFLPASEVCFTSASVLNYKLLPPSLIRKAVALVGATATPNDLALEADFFLEHSRAPHTYALAPAGEIGRLAERKSLNFAPAELAFSGNTIVGDVPVSILDGQVVPLSEATPAMRPKFLDPKYKDERSRAAQKHQRQNLANGEQIALQFSRLNSDKADSGIYNRGDLRTKLAAARRPPFEFYCLFDN